MSHFTKLTVVVPTVAETSVESNPVAHVRHILGLEEWQVAHFLSHIAQTCIDVAVVDDATAAESSEDTLSNVIKAVPVEHPLVVTQVLVTIS